ncbi:hypothetical protein NQ314_004475 [Rhamnusium bicolor]|uniref:Uncharacterized protein n=1 Tax=Rhamnusium bicolor TaxID=1586634 RepID=A0AAV8ZLH6_9CUCU|nr:hypothetical protein NQ314_004475 [Rhamnusium bicolor]
MVFGSGKTLEKDMKNWIEYKILGSRVYMRDVVPHKYIKSPKPAYQKYISQLSSSDRKRKLQSLDNLGDKVKRKFYFEDPSTSHLKVVENLASTFVKSSTPVENIEIIDNSVNCVQSPSSNFDETPLKEKYDVEVIAECEVNNKQVCHIACDFPSVVYQEKNIQTNIRPKIRSIGVNTQKIVRSCATSTEPFESLSSSMSPTSSFTNGNCATGESPIKIPSTIATN